MTAMVEVILSVQQSTSNCQGFRIVPLTYLVSFGAHTYLGGAQSAGGMLGLINLPFLQNAR